MHRFFIPPESIQGERVAFPRTAAEQLRNVLRVAPGDRVIALVDDGWEYEVEVTHIGRGDAAGKVLGRTPNQREPGIELTLYQCLLKKDHFEWVLQKCTEVGVSRFVPVVSERTILRGAEGMGHVKQERWLRIITEAAEQSGRGRIPALDPVMTFSKALEGCAMQEFKAIAWEEEHTLTTAALQINEKPSKIGLIVGPEGGFSPSEVDQAREHGIHVVTLGARILRAETAAVVFSTLTLHQFGEMG
jgi:16S rRNA (uracil1498-N3)-methyltransferase